MRNEYIEGIWNGESQCTFAASPRGYIKAQ